MSILTVALLQIAAYGNDQQQNLAKGAEDCRQAKRLGADIALFPEMWSVGYTPAAALDPEVSDIHRAPHLWAEHAAPDLPSPAEIWHGLAITRDSPFVRQFQDLAVELDMAIALTYFEAWPGFPRNTVSLIDRHPASSSPTPRCTRAPSVPTNAR